MRRIVLLGRNGQLGWELQRSLAPIAEVIALDRCASSKGRSATPEGAGNGALCGDLYQIDALAATIRTLQPDVVVNAAAYTAVDRAEAEHAAAEAMNSTAPDALARTCAELNSWLVHYSTDYVFDGSGDRAWMEEDPTAPLNVYGRTKWEGEERIRASGCRHLILRTSWVYAARGANFPKSMLRLASERDELRVVSDQVGAPTGADLLADVTAHALRTLAHDPKRGGTYHAAAGGETSWFDYARFVIARARDRGWPVKLHQDSITPVPSSAYPTPAQRPKNSRLSCRKLECAFGLRMPPWQDGVERLLAELLSLEGRDCT